MPRPGPGGVDPSELERNLVRYRALALLARSYLWVPVLLLYALSQFGLRTALTLVAVYYLAVVASEVPTGWVSDRWGRTRALVAGAVCWIAAHASFLAAGDHVWGFAVANVLLAVGYAFRSGTDVAFHYDTLEALGRTDEYEARESRVSRDALVATAVGCLIGGLLGWVDLRLPYAAALVAAGVELVIALGLTEPSAHSAAPDDPSRLAGVLRRVAEPMLLWLVLYALAEVVMEHLVSDLGQSYIATVIGDGGDDLGPAAAVSGVVVAVVSIVAAAGAALTPALRRRLGTIGALLAMAALQLGVLGTMALTTSTLVVPLLGLRSLQPAVSRILISAAAAPRLGAGQRATFLSLCSMAGRLGYGLALLGIAGLEDERDAVRAAAALAATLLVVVAAASRRPALAVAVD
jgi:MFS family permease